MPQLAAITINDGAATPVARNFTPTDVQAGVATLHDRSGGIVVGYPKVSIELRFPKPQAGRNQQERPGNRNVRVLYKVALPILEQTSASTSTGIQPAPTKAYEMIHNGEFVLPERSTLQDRKHLNALTKNLLANALMTAVVEQLESIY